MICNFKAVLKINRKEFKSDSQKFLCDSFADTLRTLRLKSQSNKIHLRLTIFIIVLFSFSTVSAQSTDSVSQQQSVRQEDVFEKVDVKATIEYAAWRQHLESQLQAIVDSAAALGIPSGKHIVKVRFIVERDGSITNVKAMNDPGYGLAKGAEMILATSPKWTAAKKKGKKVRSYYIQPIGFVITEEE
jgi:hypothetical protein